MILDTTTLIYALLGTTAILIVLVVYMWVRLSRLLRGKDAKTLEDTIMKLLTETDSLHKSREETEAYLKKVEERLRRAVSGIGTVRFNPFKGSSGSNQSFATAFTSEEGDGVVFSSLYSRERVSVFAKPISKGKSEYELTQEEKEAIAKAKPERIQE